MKVIVYVEGPSDKDALHALLKAVIDEGRSRGVGISFSPQGGKAPILNDVPRKAADHLKQNPGDYRLRGRCCGRACSKSAPKLL